MLTSKKLFALGKFDFSRKDGFSFDESEVKMYKRVVSLLLCMAMVCGLVMPVSAYTAHTQDQALSWAKSKVGKTVDYDGALGGQCVDLIFAYYDYLGVDVVYDDARDFRTNKLPQGWKRIPGGKPQPGDILIWMATEYGHVGIYASDQLTYEQNWNYQQYVQEVTSPYNAEYKHYWGLIRPDFRHEHHYEKDHTVAPTCTREGCTVYRCACGKTVKRNPVPALGHSYGEGAVTTAPNCTEQGVRTCFCTRCGAEKTEAVPATGEHHWDNGTLTTPSTCTEPGVCTYRCRDCGAEMTVETELADHDWKARQRVPATATDDGYTVYECSACGRRRTSRDVTVGGDWSTSRPAAGPEQEIESKRQYRYSALVPGESSWRKTDSGTIDYARFPSGFPKSHELYRRYGVQPRKSGETADHKTVVKSQGKVGYIYWHWCCGTYDGGPVNREVADHKTGPHQQFHAFFSTTPPDDLRYVTGTYEYPRADHCRDSYWYYCLPVYRQTYADYQKVTSVGGWGHWSAWDDRPVASTPERKVEVRTVYRTAEPRLTVLQSPQDTARAPGLKADFSVVTNREDVTCQWYISTDEHTWKPCEGEVEAQLRLPVTEDLGTLWVKCVITDSSGAQVTTRAARLRMEYCQGAPMLEGFVDEVSGKPSLFWGAMEHVKCYQLYRDGQRVGETENTWLRDDSAVPGQRCTYRVRAVLHNGTTSDWSETVSVVCTCAQPEVDITHRTDGKPVLRWKAVDGAEAYAVYRSVDGGSFTKFYTAHGTRLTHGSAQSGRTYTYRVRALCANERGHSIPSAAVEGRCVRPAPTLHLALKPSTGKPVLTWDQVDGAERYEVWYRTRNQQPQRLFTTRGDHLTHGSAQPGTAYYYQVRAVDGAFSDEKHVACDCARPDVHAGLRGGKPYLRWDAVDGAVQYEVFCSVDGGSYHRLLTVGGTHLRHGSAKSGHTYKYRVKALCRNQFGSSALSYIDTIHL